jgi:hypothetical protein
MTPNRLLASVALALSLGLGTGAAFAQSKKELVAKVLQLQQGGIEMLGNTVATTTANQIMAAAGRQLSRVPADKREALVKDMQAEVRKFLEDLAPLLRQASVKLAPASLGAAYEEKFSEDELKTVLAWLESPVSKKYQQVGMEQQQALMQKVIAETKGQVEPKIKTLEKTLTAQIEAAGGGTKPSGDKK